MGLYSIGVRPGPVRNAGTAAGEIKSVYGARAEQKTGKTLIVYFPQTGNTEGLADLIHEMSGADIFRLERKIPYSSSSNGPILYLAEHDPLQERQGFGKAAGDDGKRLKNFKVFIYQDAFPLP